MSTQKKQLTDQATKNLVSQLKQSIATAEYRPGEWLKQIDVENTFSVNRFTVRAAFTELTSGGFLEHVPYRGHRVMEHSIQERIAITEARELIEAATALKVMANIDETGLNQLQQLAEDFRQALEQDDRPAMMQHNFAFHRAFNAHCHNHYLSEAVDNMRERGVGTANRGWSKRQVTEASCQDHFDMIQALREKNILRLQSLIHIHLNRWRESHEHL